jgi:hypothetical protein
MPSEITKKINRMEVMDDAMADVLRQMTEAERLRIAAGMWQSARVILRGAIRTEHPDWDTERVNREIARRISHGAVNQEKLDRGYISSWAEKLGVAQEWQLIIDRLKEQGT